MALVGAGARLGLFWISTETGPCWHSVGGALASLGVNDEMFWPTWTMISFGIDFAVLRDDAVADGLGTSNDHPTIAPQQGEDGIRNTNGSGIGSAPRILVLRYDAITPVPETGSPRQNVDVTVEDTDGDIVAVVCTYPGSTGTPIVARGSLDEPVTSGTYSYTFLILGLDVGETIDVGVVVEDAEGNRSNEVTARIVGALP
jgi:hypothetical protein